MSIVKFESLSSQSIDKDLNYLETLLIPIESLSGPQVDTIYSLSEFYSKYTPTDPSVGYLIKRLLNQGYRIQILRMNYINEFSTIRIQSKGNYTYFDNTKEYDQGSGDVTSLLNIGNSQLVYDLDFSKSLTDFDGNLNFITNEWGYIEFTYPYSYCLYFFNGDEDLTVVDNQSYIAYDFISNINSMSVSYLTLLVYEILSDRLGSKITKSGLNLKIIFNELGNIHTNINGILDNQNIKGTFDEVHSNSLGLKGVSFKSKVEDSSNGIKLVIYSNYPGDLTFDISRVHEGITLFNEVINGELDPSSSYYLINNLKNSKLIEYIDGEITEDIIGTYYLGYSQESEFNLFDYIPEVTLFKDDSIAFILDVNKWKSKESYWGLNEYDPLYGRSFDSTDTDLINVIAQFELNYSDYVSKASLFLRRLSSLGNALESVVLSDCMILSKSTLDSLRNLLVVAPKVIGTDIEYSYELLLRNLGINRMESTVQYEGRIESGIQYESSHQCVISYDSYKFHLTMPYINFQGKEISLRYYLGWYVVNRYICEYIMNHSIAKNEVNNYDSVRTAVMDRYNDFVTGLDITSTKVGRSVQVDIVIDFDIQTTKNLTLISHLMEE